MKNKNDFLDLVVYQIYPRSFKDSNNDGIGDFNGIISKLDYLKELGINAIWLCPVFKSPCVDNGYDISDYYDFNSDFGTKEEFFNLIKEAHNRDIKIIIDLVANHTSDEHPWFKEARKSKDNPYHDYYYFYDKPLNNWKSIFGGSAWEYNKETNEYYLHTFAIKQPDVNWTNPKVRGEYKKIVDYYKEIGVDGFRCDAFDYISKDFNSSKLQGGKKVHEYIKELLNRDSVSNLFSVGECESSKKSILKLSGKHRHELKCIFNFNHFDCGRINKMIKAKDVSLSQVRDIIDYNERFSIRHNIIYTLLTDNHDHSFFNSRVGDESLYRYESSTAICTMFYLLKGIPFIYQSQEIGSVNSFVEDIKEINDIEILGFYNDNKDKYGKKEMLEMCNFGSRDNTRRPFAWDNSSSHGFTINHEPWLDYPSRANEINLENDLNNNKSIHRFYKNLLEFRNNSSSIKRGKYKNLSKDNNSYIYKRWDKDESYIIIINFENKNIINVDKYKELVMSNYNKENYDNSFEKYEIRIYKQK